MPEYPMTESILTSFSAQEPWPDNVKLYQPYEVEQILLPDNANCLAVQAFLKMCNLPFEVEMRWNAEYMSPSGRVPFIKCGAFVVSELEPIVQFVANKGVSLCSRLAAEDKAELRAYMSLISNVLLNAELYISWLDADTFATVTSVRNSSVYPWPLGWIQTRAKRNLVSKRLKALHWQDKTLDQVLADVEQCCNSLSQRLGDKDYFFGTPTPLDALVYGHIRALLSANGPKAALFIKPITSLLLRHVLRVANLTEMKLTPQEEYLILVSYRVCVRRRNSPERSKSRFRSKCSVRSSRDTLAWNKDVFGFKPFQSKQLTLLTNKEGGITCEIGRKKVKNFAAINEDQMFFASDIIEDLLDKVEEYAFTEKMFVDIDRNENDFEVIAFPNQVDGSKFGSVDLQSKYDDYSEIDNDIGYIDNDTDIGDNLHLNVLEEPLAITCDGANSDGLVVEKILSAQLVKPLLQDELNNLDSEFDSSNNNEHLDESFVTIACHGDQGSLRNLSEKAESEKMDDKSIKSSKSNASTKISAISSVSKNILRMPSNEEISVESLLKYLRKQNAAYNDYADIADID